jgi:hypothetical protein
MIRSSLRLVARGVSSGLLQLAIAGDHSIAEKQHGKWCMAAGPSRAVADGGGDQAVGSEHLLPLPPVSGSPVLAGRMFSVEARWCRN